MATLKERQKQIIQASAAGVLLLGASLILLNLLANWAFLRWDITRHQVYSLSAASKKLVRSLDDPLIIKAYFSPDLPAPYNSYSRYVRDILIEYRAASKGRIRFEFISPLPPQAFEAQATDAGLQPIQFEELGSSQVQIKRGFMGLVMFYRDHSETLPVVKDMKSLEYDLTSRIARMTQRTKKRIAVMNGHGEINWKVPQLKFAADVPEMFDIQDVTLPLATTAPLEADALLIVGPTQRYDDKSLWTIDQAIMRGTPVAFLLDAKHFMPSQFFVMPQKTGLEDLLKAYGVELRDALIYDAQCQTVNMTQNMGGMAFTSSVRYPFIPLITHFDKDSPIVQGIDSVSTPFVTELAAPQLPAGVRFVDLLETSEHSWRAPSSLYKITPNDVPQPNPDDPHGPYTVGALMEGTFPSYFAGKPVPIPGQTLIPSSAKVSLFVFSTSHILDPNLPEFPGIEALLTNMLAYLTHDEILVGIRSKGEILRPLKLISPLERELAKLGMILGVPALPILLGLLRWRRRELWRKALAAQFAPAPAPEPTV